MQTFKNTLPPFIGCWQLVVQSIGDADITNDMVLSFKESDESDTYEIEPHVAYREAYKEALTALGVDASEIAGKVLS